VLARGAVAPAVGGTVPAVTCALTPGLVLRLGAGDESAWSEVTVAGDTDFAASVHQLARHLRWDFEEDLARVFGDIPAHRMAETARTLQRWGGRSFDGSVRAFAEYWTEEQPLIASARAVKDFAREVDLLRDDVARLEKRVEHLSNRQTAKFAKKN
jgi:ubiquinone biosynthesis protein UbiJ